MYYLKKNIEVIVTYKLLKDIVLTYTLPEFQINLAPVKKHEYDIFDKIDTNSIGIGEYYQTLSETDIFLFNKKSLDLASIRLSHSNKEKKINNNILENIKHSKKGSLQLVTKEKNIIKDLKKPFKYRYYNRKKNQLISYGNKFRKSKQIDLKLNIFEGFSLLFNEEKKYCGWILQNPEKHLVQYYFYRKDLDSHIDFKHVPPHPRLKEYFYRTYSFIKDDIFDNISNQYEDPDASILKSVNDLYIELLQIENPCIGIISLKESIERTAKSEYALRFDTPFGEPLSEEERAKEYRPNKRH